MPSAARLRRLLATKPRGIYSDGRRLAADAALRWPEADLVQFAMDSLYFKYRYLREDGTFLLTTPDAAARASEQGTVFVSPEDLDVLLLPVGHELRPEGWQPAFLGTGRAFADGARALNGRPRRMPSRTARQWRHGDPGHELPKSDNSPRARLARIIRL